MYLYLSLTLLVLSFFPLSLSLFDFFPSLFSLLFSLFSFCLPLTAMWSYPSRCLLPCARSLARLICVAVQRRHPHKRRDARTLSLLVLFFCVAASRKVSRPNPRCQNLRSQTHVLIHALRKLCLNKSTSYSMLSESHISKPTC